MINTKQNFSTENKLLIYCAQAVIADKAKNKIQEMLDCNINWHYILQESIKQGIACLVYTNLLYLKDRLPKNIWAIFNDIYYLNASRNIKIYRQINTVLSSFNKENLKVIPLKGAYLAEKIYDNIALRTMADIDLLIKKENLPKIDKLLLNLGYKATVHKDLLPAAITKSYLNSIDYFKNGENSSTLHIHWHIVNVTLPTYLYTKKIKMEKFWECAIPYKIAGVETLQLAPHHLIMYLSEHALKHSLDKLILLSDIDAVIKKYKNEINWKKLIKDTIEFGMERQVFYGLYFTKYYLGTDIPDYTLAKIKPKDIGFLERRFFYAILNNNRSSKLCYFVYLTMVKGPINKLKFLFRTLFPPPCVIALTFNLNKPKVTIKDYLLFLNKQLLHLKKVCFHK